MIDIESVARRIVEYISSIGPQPLQVLADNSFTISPQLELSQTDADHQHFAAANTAASMAIQLQVHGGLTSQRTLAL